MGILNNVLPFSLIVWGQMHIASGLASILNATTPIFTVLVAGLLPDTIYLGSISHNTPNGLAALTIIRIGN